MLSWMLAIVCCLTWCWPLCVQAQVEPRNLLTSLTVVFCKRREITLLLSHFRNVGIFVKPLQQSSFILWMNTAIDSLNSSNVCFKIKNKAIHVTFFFNQCLVWSHVTVYSSVKWVPLSCPIQFYITENWKQQASNCCILNNSIF